MTPETWQRLQGQFELAIELEPVDREALITRLATEDPELADELQAMLEADAESQDATVVGKALQRLAGEAADQNRRWQQQDGAPLSSPKDIGGLGPYTVERPLGRGGMATVYRARRADGAYEQCVAIKILAVQTPEMNRRFRTERQILARLDHPNIVRLLDGGETAQGLPFAVLEYVEGEPIHRFCERRRLAVARRLDLFRTVCSAVRHAHRHGIVHRDLKPDNILVTTDHVPKVLDFGIAKALQQAQLPGTVARTEPGTRLLTPSYASPEQHRGEPVTPASDLYALGLVLLALLTDERPPSVVDTTAEERLGIARRRLRRNKTDGALARVVEKALATSPNDRFANAQELADALLPPDRPQRRQLRSFLVAAAALAVASLAWWVKSGSAPDPVSTVEALTGLVHRRADLATERARPTHDIRAARDDLQRAIAAVEARLDEIRPSLRSLALSELGSAHLAMGVLSSARDHLQAAYDAGRRDHATLRDLAITLGLMELELTQAGPLGASRLREEPKASSSAALARQALQRSLSDVGHGPGSGAYVRALLAAIEGSSEAVRLHTAMAVGTPWEAPAYLLEARVFNHNPSVAAAAFTAATHAAPSDFRAHWGLCLLSLETDDAESSIDAPLGPSKPQIDNDACRRAMSIRPDSSEAQAALSRLQARQPRSNGALATENQQPAGRP